MVLSDYNNTLAKVKTQKRKIPNLIWFNCMDNTLASMLPVHTTTCDICHT
jgi:hypothetical protein